MEIPVAVKKTSASREGGKRVRFCGKSVAMALLAVCVVFAAAATFFYIKNRSLTTEQVASRICPCVVGVVQYKNDGVTENGEGSGIVFTSDGYIVTNNHVVEGSDKIEVVSSSGKRYTALKIGRDARTDLAVIKIKANGLKTASFGNSAVCRVGEKVVAIGNPSGLKLAGSVTQGIISAVNRDIDVGNGPMNLLQTDAAINPGNSGGALVDMKGMVIGINSAKISGQGYEGIGFSIPISSARPIIENLIKYGYVKGRVRMGLNCRIIGDVTAKANSIPAGAFVEYVDPKSGAASSGIKAGDIITMLGNKRVTSTSTLLTERDKHKPGEFVTVTVYRRITSGTLIFNLKLTEDKGVYSSNEASAGW